VPGTEAPVGRPCDAGGDVPLGLLECGRRIVAERQPGGGRGREGAAGAVVVAGRDPVGGERMFTVGGHDHVPQLDAGARVEVAGMLIPGSHERYRSLGTIEVEEIIEL
jgi:hypothetical protein